MPCGEQLRPRSAAAEHQRGLALAKSGDFDKYCCPSLPTFFPWKFSASFKKLSICNLTDGNGACLLFDLWFRALAAYKAAVRKDDKLAISHNNMGVLLAKLAKYDQVRFRVQGASHLNSLPMQCSP